MTYDEVLRNRRRQSSAVKQKILSKAYREDIDFIFLVEGDEDQHFYEHFFEERLGEVSIFTIVCSGKQGVLGARDYVDESNYNKKCFLFFIDKDHDDLLGLDYRREDTFVTSNYSVEWFVVCSGVVERIIRKVFGISRDDPILKRTMDVYRKRRTRVITRARPLMALAATRRRNGVDVDLSKISFDMFFLCDSSVFCKKRVDKEALSAAFLFDGVITWRQLREARFDFRGIPDEHYIRGKFVFDFLWKYLEVLKCEIVNTQKENNRKVKVQVNIAKSGLIGFAASLMGCPEDLLIFIEGAKNRRFHNGN